MTHDILWALLRTTCVLTLCGGVCFLALRNIEHHLPKLSRLLWIAVLLTGWFWLQPVIHVKTAGETAAEEEDVAVTPVLYHSEGGGITTSSLPFGKRVRGNHLSQSSDNPRPSPLPEGEGTLFVQPPPFMGTTILLAVWFGGMVIMIIAAAAGYIRVLYCLRNTEPAGDALSEPWRNLLTEHGIDSRAVPMLLSDNLGPALIRTPLGYRLVVPGELWSELSEPGRQGILKHELAHFRRRDVWKSFFVRILALPHWFNPVAHYAANRFDELAEQLCDREAFAGRREEVSEFARILLLLHENAPTHFVVRQSIFGRNLQRRVAALLNPPLERRFAMRKTLLVIGTAAILCAALFRIEFVATQEPTKESGTTAPEQINPGTARSTAPSPALSGQNYHWTSVIDAETQKPLAGVKATLYFAQPGGKEVDTRSTQSDGQGRIFFPLPSELNADEEAVTEILVEKEGYVAENGGCQAQWAERFLKEGKIVCDVFPLQKAEPITGRFVDEQGKPLADVLVAVFRQMVKPYGIEELGRIQSLEFKTDADGRFRIDAAKNEKIVFWAVPEKFAPQYVFPEQKRGDQGSITIEKGFEPVVTILDKDGKPVQDVWVNLERYGENYMSGEHSMSVLSAYTRSALTDQDGKARFRPVAEGEYSIRVSERPRERFFSPWSITSSVNWRARNADDQKPVKGIYSTMQVKFSAASPQTTLHAANIVNVDVQFSDKATNSLRDLNTNIVGGRSDNRSFAARTSSDSPSAYRGEGLFSFQVPAGLTEASLNLPYDTDSSYRVKIGGKDDWLEPKNDVNFPLGNIVQAMNIDVTTYKSPKVTLNVVDEAGQPVKEYYAWLEYVKEGTPPAKIKVEGEKIRVDRTPEHYQELGWDFAASKMSLFGVLDITFKYKNFGKDETKINGSGILPDEAMNLHVVGKGYKIHMQAIPNMSEGEERELTVTLTK